MMQDRCRKWAKNGECNTNAGWMNTNCRKSCGSCTNVQSFTQVLSCLPSFIASPDPAGCGRLHEWAFDELLKVIR